MEKIVIRGGRRLCGSVDISGAKNAAVAILAGAILSDGVCRISNLPLISDTIAILRVLQDLGARVTYPEEHTVEIDPKGIHSHVVPLSMTKSMRASTYFIGALLGRFNKACVAPPGGCDFGVRPIDQHLKGFQGLGAKVAIDNGMVDVKAQTLTGSSIYLDMVSVGATINIMLAAVKAKGLTIIGNAAREPHVVDLANFLNSMGADIMGAGTSIIKIRGVESLSGTDYMIIPDQIEAGTYMVAAAATRGDVTINNITPKHLESITAKLKELGAKIYEDTESLRIVIDDRPTGCSIKTMPHPGFPT
ncbi:MAG: UDP-N-acetylglucosamine 1-carboxyvinyltransferase, partial [Clostridia bacterium]|nr:UDP-N-acetylglucosamine 1-carboxyvinyltransferase [Clostridia bacterium]